MKKFILILLIITAVFAASACSQHNSTEENGLRNDVASSPLTTKNLNDLRSVISVAVSAETPGAPYGGNDVSGESWGYALVAGDCVFVKEGYYKFSDVVESRFANAGLNLGERGERDLFFARGERSVYGVFRAKKGTYYAVSIDYDDPVLRYSYMDTAGLDEADGVFVGGEGSDECRLILFGRTLIAYSYKNMVELARREIPAGESVEDFAFYQKGNSAVFAAENSVKIYTYEPSAREFFAISADIQLDSGDIPAVFDGVYFFKADRYAVLSGGEVPPETLEKYPAYLSLKENPKEEWMGYAVYVSGGAATLEKGSETLATFTAETLAENLPEVKRMLEKRKAESGKAEIISARFLYGKLFIIWEKQPETPFIGLRSVNDGIPQTVVCYDLESGAYSFAGMIDFTWFNIYKIVKL